MREFKFREFRFKAGQWVHVVSGQRVGWRGRVLFRSTDADGDEAYLVEFGDDRRVLLRGEEIQAIEPAVADSARITHTEVCEHEWRAVDADVSLSWKKGDEFQIDHRGVSACRLNRSEIAALRSLIDAALEEVEK